MRPVGIIMAVCLLKAMLLFVVLPSGTHLLEVGSASYGLGFADLYDNIGNNLAHGRGYKVESAMGYTMIREPGYPLFLAGLFNIGGYRIEMAQVGNLLLSLGIAFMLMRLARKLVDDRAVVTISVLLFLFHPGIVLSEARGTVEVMFIFGLVAFMLALYWAIEKPRLWRYLMAGLILGTTVLVRSTPLLFPVFLLAYLILIANSRSERWRTVANIAVLQAGVLLAMSPWIIRNYLLIHEFVPTATVQGVAAQEGLYTCKNLSLHTDFYAVQRQAAEERNKIAKSMGVPFEGYYYQLFYTPQDEVSFNKRLLRSVVSEYKTHPALAAQCAGENVGKFFVLGKTWQGTWLNALIEVPFLVLAISGAFVLWKRGQLRKMGIVLTFMTYLVLVHSAVIAHTRHSIPLMPFVSILASVSLVNIRPEGSRRLLRTLGIMDNWQGR